MYKKKTVLVVVIMFSIVSYFFMEWLRHPLPIIEGSIKIEALKEVVDVYTDEFGVPHVFANNEEDLFFAAGYIAARDRLFQLATVNLAVKGGLASVLGPKYLKNDIYFRTWKIHDTAKLLVKKMNKKNRKIFERFCDGINHRMDEVMDDLPLEFKLMNFKPEHWTPVIVAGYGRMMAHEMSGSWKPEIVYGAVESYFGSEKLRELIPNGEVDIPTIAQNLTDDLKTLYDNVLNSEYEQRDLFGDFSADIGSNNWVVSGSRSVTGLPFLANDPHLGFSQPPRWYEIHLKGGRFNVSGVCIAGIPLPVIGQNERTAWGFTNTMVDDLDFYVIELNPENNNEYLYKSEWYPIKIKKEVFKIKGGTDTTIHVRSTHHGPIISDVHHLLNTSDKVLSMSWTGHWITNELDAWVGLTTMKNWKDFSNAVQSFGVPGQNIVYADVDGNIGWRPAVYVPIRKAGFSMVPRPGHDESYDWKGRIPFEEMPFLFNPDKGYISTANNRTIGKEFPYYISGLWADPSRASRIDELLSMKENLDINDMKDIQLDLFSNYAKEITPYIIENGQWTNSTGHARALRFLKEWNFIESIDSQASLIFHSINNKIIKNIYGDELSLLGPKYLEAYLGLKYLTKRNLRWVLNNGRSSWIDDINTKDTVENINDIIKRSVNDGLRDIINNHGPNWSNWKWGIAHSVTHKHLLGEINMLEYLFSLNVGPFLSGGSDVTPNAGGYSVHKGFNQTSGASMRRIVDFSNMNNTQMIIPTGQSGLHNSTHYKDQAPLYHSGEYRTTRFEESYIRQNDKFKKLRLLP